MLMLISLASPSNAVSHIDSQDHVKVSSYTKIKVNHSYILIAILSAFSLKGSLHVVQTGVLKDISQQSGHAG